MRSPALEYKGLGSSLIGEEERDQALSVIADRALFRFQTGTARSKACLLEDQLSRRVGVRHALAVTSGTAALVTALKASGIGPGDLVAVPAYTWIGTANAVLSIGAVPVFVEVDGSLTIDCDELQSGILHECAALIPVHMGGAAADMPKVVGAAPRGLIVVEDCAQALGATLQGRSVGSFGAAAAFSFQHNKIVTAGEGGALLTDDRSFFERAARFHDHGFFRLDAADGAEHRSALTDAGTNFRMSELTAAVAGAQMARLPTVLSRLRSIHASVLRQIDGCAELTPRPLADPEGDTGTVLVFQLLSSDRADEFSRALCCEGIPTSVLWNDKGHVFHHFHQRMIDAIDKNATNLARHKASFLRDLPKTLNKSADILKRTIRITISPAYEDADRDDIAKAILKVSEHIQR